MNTLVINFTMAALYRACKHCTAYMLAVGQWRTEGSFGVFKPPPPQIPKALQNRAKLNLIVKTVKIAEFRTPTRCSEKRQ